MVFKPENELTAAHREAHARSDVNSSFNAQHHTLGDGPTNAASGSHLHGMNPLTATVPANVTKSGASATTKTALCSVTVKINL